ncbi:sugar phosphate isomerase/epimerase family protein [Rubellimicrobium aerolatum]|uniref:Sugar phosphate isomerase/epimerase family protein n=1 Tax=Rubellimicrobium aerolatum TaxID=490979 RepID=A0ABW0SD72_9RHOB|nr:sugar phosphate isomerase/epimerase [Rubellimicrobium aerolatum]MBP1806579.1 sugar phosphate isomerase/epimerase [Rubellimicrobium aerolatum]
MPTIAYQLYCSRNFPPLDGTLSMLAGAGYKAVEGYGGLYDDLAGLKAGLDRNGLSMPSGHFALDMVEGDPARTLKVARALGVQKVIVPWVAPELRGTDLDSWKSFAQRLATALAPIRDEGFVTGWHNHDWDFADLGGTTPMDLIVDAGLDLELDLGWVKRAGLDPVETLRRFSGRVRAVHVKDLAPEGQNAEEDGWADVGHGTQDWAAIKAELDAQGIDHFVIEHDNPADHARFARRSLESVQAW